MSIFATMIQTEKPIAALFDLDGVIFDTEPQYSIFWGSECARFRPDIPGLASAFKGQTLKFIFDNYFTDPEVQQILVKELNEFEANMNYEYVAGAEQFIQELRSNGVKVAVVTSSDKNKMDSVKRAHPEFEQLFDRILTAELFSASKPNPDCYLLGARVFDAPLQNCMVFEDSFNGLKAGMSSGIFTVGLSTTNPREAIAPHCYHVIPDFSEFSFADFMCLLS